MTMLDIFESRGLWGLYIVVLSCVLVYSISFIAYNLYFHPLASYPGPKLFTSNRYVSIYYALRGRIPYKVAELHAQYGPVVRTSSNTLSYNSTDGWAGILRARPGLSKDPNVGPPPPDGVKGLAFVGSEEDHARMRRNLSHGFSEKALREQETILHEYIDLFITKLKQKGTNQPINITAWLNLVTVDIIAKLTFGIPFDCLTSETLHPWMANVFRFLKAFVIVGGLSKVWPIGYIILGLAKIIPGFKEKELLHRGFINEKLDNRLAKDEPVTDFMTYVSRHTGKETGMSLYELRETTNALMLGGTETVATSLSGTIYNILSCPSVYKRLNDEIRSAFPDEASITITSTNSLSYMNAVIQEGMRILPPAPGNILRVASAEGNIIDGKYVPPSTMLSVSHWAAYHSSTNFYLPDEFHPERWLPISASEDNEAFENDQRSVFQPFSAGVRNCIGQSLARAEMRLLLARLVWNFDWELVEEESMGWRDVFPVWAVYEKTPLVLRLKSVDTA